MFSCSLFLWVSSSCLRVLSHSNCRCRSNSRLAAFIHTCTQMKCFLALHIIMKVFTVTLTYLNKLYINVRKLPLLRSHWLNKESDPAHVCSLAWVLSDVTEITRITGHTKLMPAYQTRSVCFISSPPFSLSPCVSPLLSVSPSPSVSPAVCPAHAVCVALVQVVLALSSPAPLSPAPPASPAPSFAAPAEPAGASPAPGFHAQSSRVSYPRKWLRGEMSLGHTTLPSSCCQATVIKISTLMLSVLAMRPQF